MNYDFLIIRGDSCYITVTKKNDAGEQINFIETDVLVFSAKKKLNQSEYDIHSTKFTLNEGKAIIELSSTDTDVPDGEYYYDVQYTNELNDVYTLIKGILTVDWDVTTNEL